jgi:hypothetical protein
METAAVHVGARKKLSLVIANPVTMISLFLTAYANTLVLSKHDFWAYASEVWFLNLVMGSVLLFNLNSSLIAYRRTWRALERRLARGQSNKTKFRVWLWIKVLKMPCSVVGALVAVRDFNKTYQRDSNQEAKS